MPTFKPIRQFKVSREVTDQLKRSILTGDFKPGDKLPAERDLAEEFHVSRLAIREALQTLANSGFIIIRQGATGGAFVTDLSFEYLSGAFLDLFLVEKITIPELNHVRSLIEPEVARMAASRVTPEYARQLQESLEAERLPVKELLDDVDRKTRVHFVLAEMCGSRFLEALVRSLMRMTRRIVEVVQPDPQSMHPAGMHEAVVKAVLAGNPDAAAEAMKKHEVEFGEILVKMERAYREKSANQS